MRAVEDGGGAGALSPAMLAEARRQRCTPSALMDRLYCVLVFYAWRCAAGLAAAAPQGLWSLLRRPGLAQLLQDLFEQPAQAWTVETMARRVQLSRAAFFRKFGDACGQSPLPLLLLVRMQMAVTRLEKGEPMARPAEAVGYAAYATFARAFRRACGERDLPSLEAVEVASGQHQYAACPAAAWLEAASRPSPDRCRLTARSRRSLPHACRNQPGRTSAPAGTRQHPARPMDGKKNRPWAFSSATPCRCRRGPSRAWHRPPSRARACETADLLVYTPTWSPRLILGEVRGQHQMEAAPLPRV